MNSATTLSSKQIRSIALPSEHGSWGFLFEPLLIGLCVAGSSAGLLLAVAILGAFPIHQPLKLTLKDHLKRRRTTRTIHAERFTTGYGALALIFFGAVALISDLHFFRPLLLALPLLLVQVWYDARNKSRVLLPELCGALALGSAASAVAMLGGWSFEASLPLWMIAGSRSIPSILYVRARLKLEHGKPFRRYPSWIAHGAVLLIIAWLAIAQMIPAIVVGAFVLLFARALIGLSSRRKPRPAKQIGMLEIAYGLIVVTLAVIGYTTSS